jgi:hypothetical protein
LTLGRWSLSAPSATKKRLICNGNYTPAAREFQHQLIALNLIHQWDYTCIFDGRPPIEKCHEHQRRRGRDDSVVVDSTFIAICAKICKRHFVKYVVAPYEADMQVGRQKEGTVAVCRDSDEIAYGNKLVVIIDNYQKEEYRVIDLLDTWEPWSAQLLDVAASK